MDFPFNQITRTYIRQLSLQLLVVSGALAAHLAYVQTIPIAYGANSSSIGPKTPSMAVQVDLSVRLCLEADPKQREAEDLERDG